MPGPLSRAISARIRAVIAERLDVKQGAVAVASGISKSQMSSILNDKKSFELDQLDRVCFSLRLNLTNEIAAAEEALETRHAGPDAVAKRV